MLELVERAKFGKNSASTSNGVPASISSTNSTSAAGTSLRRTRTGRPPGTRCWSPAVGGVDELAAPWPARRRAAARPPGRARRGSTGPGCGAAAGRPRWSRSRPTPATRSPNSSGCRSAKAMIDMPPIEWPTSTTGPSGATCPITVARSSPSWSIGGVLAVGPPGAAVRALVVEDHPVLAAEGRALEVPAVEVERVAVHEDDGQLAVGYAAAHGVRRRTRRSRRAGRRRRRR